MKRFNRIMMSLVLSFFIGLTTNAQNNDLRTVDTKIADIVMLLPAQNGEAFNKLMGELSDIPTAVHSLSSLLSEPGKGDDSQIRYALAGLSFYISQQGKEAEKVLHAAAFCRAIEGVDSEEIKDFLLTQLQYIAGNREVTYMAALLGNRRLCDPAARVLVRINTDEANRALIKALSSSTDDGLTMVLVGALGSTRCKDAVKQISVSAVSDNVQLKYAALHALAEIGSPASQKLLYGAARDAGFVFDASDALGSYILFLTNLQKSGYGALVAKGAKVLLDNTADETQTAAKSAALALYVAAQGDKALPVAVGALNSVSSAYRGAAIESLVALNTPQAVQALIKTGQQTDNFALKSELIRTLGRIKCKDALPFVEQSLMSSDSHVLQAAIYAYGNIDRSLSPLPVLAAMNRSDSKVIQTAKEILLTNESAGLNSIIGAGIKDSNSKACVALIEVLAMKRAAAQLPVVLVAAKSADKEVAFAAEKALQYLVAEKDLVDVAELLEKYSESKDLQHLQNAFYATVQNSGDVSKQTAVTAVRMGISPSRAYAYYNVLAMIGGGEGLKIVSDAFNGGNSDVQAHAFRALINWRGFEAAPVLYQIALTDTEYKISALEGYVAKIVPSENTREQKIEYLRNALDIKMSDKLLVAAIGEVAKIPIFPALSIADQYIDHPSADVQQAAVQAVIKIVQANNSIKGASVKASIEKAIALNKDPEAEYQKEALVTLMRDWNDSKGAVPYVLSDDELREGFVPLFNGVDMSGWMGNLRDYVAIDGTIVCDPQYGGQGNLYTQKEYADFVLRFDFLLTPAANNGLGIRTPAEGDAAYVGMELQILDNTAEVYKNLKEYQYHGSVYGVIAAKKGALKPVGEWNSQEVSAVGNRIKVVLNGIVIVDGDISEASNGFSRTADGREHPGLSNAKGHIGFLGHGSYVAFKNLRIKSIF